MFASFRSNALLFAPIRSPNQLERIKAACRGIAMRTNSESLLLLIVHNFILSIKSILEFSIVTSTATEPVTYGLFCEITFLFRLFLILFYKRYNLYEGQCLALNLLVYYDKCLQISYLKYSCILKFFNRSFHGSPREQLAKCF